MGVGRGGSRSEKLQFVKILVTPFFPIFSSSVPLSKFVPLFAATTTTVHLEKERISLAGKGRPNYMLRSRSLSRPGTPAGLPLAPSKRHHRREIDDVRAPPFVRAAARKLLVV